jgi:hypothetical protein
LAARHESHTIMAALQVMTPPCRQAPLPPRWCRAVRRCRWIASRSLSSGAHSRDPVARNDVERLAQHFPRNRRQQLLECALACDVKRAQDVMVGHIRGCVDHALKDDAAGVFRKFSRNQPAAWSGS